MSSSSFSVILPVSNSFSNLPYSLFALSSAICACLFDSEAEAISSFLAPLLISRSFAFAPLMTVSA
jgi:hypothetical protein